MSDALDAILNLADQKNGPEQQPGQAVSDKNQQALLMLRNRFRDTTVRSRREYVRKCLHLHNLFRGAHYLGWNGTQFVEVPPGPDGQQPERTLFVLNFFQGFVLSIIALLAGNRPTVKFFPEDSDNLDDVAKAKASNVVVRSFERDDKPTEKLIDLVYLLCTDGTVGTYIRTHVDGERYGYDIEPIMETQQVSASGPGYECFACQQTAFDPPPDHNCPTCGAMLPSEATVQPPMFPQDVQTGTRKVPRSKTLRTDVGGLELLLPPAAAEQADFPFLAREREVDKGKVRATYPDLADKITSGSQGISSTAGTSIDRRARAESVHGTTIDGATIFIDNLDAVTLSEWWFRSTAFYQIDDKKSRDELLAAFPDGCKVTWANDVFCEARPESMDDHWSICHALPGRGQIREPIFASLVPVQELANDIVNIIRDVIELTLPIIFIDAQLLKMSAWKKSKVTPGGAYSVTPRAGRSVSDGFGQTQPGQMPEYITTFLTDLRTTIAQFLTGAFPAAYGGGTGGNTTAQGIQMETNAALGRISMFLTKIRSHYSSFMPLVINDFEKNGRAPMAIVDRNAGGTLTTTKVTPDELKRGSAKTIPEFDESFPTTWPQKQALLLQLKASPSPQDVSMIARHKNTEKMKTTLGIDLAYPGEEAYSMQWQQIDELLASEPTQTPQMQPQPVTDPNTGQPAIDPMTGQPQTQQVQVMVPTPSVAVNPLDDNATMLEACKDFRESEAGKAACAANGPGWQNFMLQVAARQAAMQAQAAAMAPPQGPATSPSGAQPPAGAPQ
jgi:hypothetical protein